MCVTGNKCLCFHCIQCNIQSSYESVTHLLGLITYFLKVSWYFKVKTNGKNVPCFDQTSVIIKLKVKIYIFCISINIKQRSKIM